MPQNLKLTKPVFTRLNGYFYTIDSSNDTLYKKVDSGENAFSYPLDQDLANECLAIQYDGTYFYTLECIATGNGQILIKRWKIEDYILKLKRVYNIIGTSNQKYNCNSFAIEYFTRSVGSAIVGNPSIITLNSNSRVSVGDILNLGPSTFTGSIGKTEQVTVLDILPGNQLQLTTSVVNNYNTNDKIVWGSRCWFFNKFQPNDPDSVNGSGQLYSFDLNPILTTVTPRKTGTQFRNVLASLFIYDANYSGGRDFLAYMNQTNLLFIETDPTSPNYLNTVESAAQNNQEINSTIIPVYAIAYEGSNIFRLQRKATYVTGTSYTTEDWGSTYNYQLSTLSRIPQSVSLTATNGVISADGTSTTPIVAIVRDQFDNPLSGKTVIFSDNDTGTGSGFCSPTIVSGTNANGIATTTYTAGTTSKTVTITADVT